MKWSWDFQGEQERSLNGDATAKRCDGDGKGCECNDGPETSPTGRRGCNGERASGFPLPR